MIDGVAAVIHRIAEDNAEFSGKGVRGITASRWIKPALP
jgi:hypothetical protein